MISKEVTPCPAALPDGRVPYDELRVWLESNLRDHYRDIRDYYDAVGWEDFTEGSVIFTDSEGKLAEDNANLFWDDANNRLGVNTNTPVGAVDVSGTVLMSRLLCGGVQP